MDYDFEIDFSDQIKAKNLDDLTYVETPEVFLKTAESDFQYMDIDINPLLNFPPAKNSSDQTKRELLEMKAFMESDHSEDFKSNLKKMDEDPAGFIINEYKKIH